MKNVKKNETAQVNLDLYKFVLSLVPTFIEIKASDIDNAIENALGKISEFVKSDRSYIYLFEDNNKRLTLTHKYYQSGIKEKITAHDRVDSEDFNWLIQPLLNNETVNILSINDLPGKASSIRAIMEV